MGIAHIEDLPTPEFLKTVESLADMQASEKLDGANLYFGLDQDSGKLFTSREGKRSSAKRIFSSDDYPYFSGTNPFRAAHQALEKVVGTIRSVMVKGQTVEIEVLFGRQPNAITYGADSKSYIAFLQAVNGTAPEVVEKLTEALQGTSVAVDTKVVSSEDGANLDLVEQETTFEFIGPQAVDMSGPASNEVLIKKLKEFNEYLNQPVDGLPESMKDVTAGELDQKSMSSVKVIDRELVKPIKERIQSEILTQFKIPIKKILLGELKDYKSKLSATDLADTEELGIEGVVLRNPENGNLVKLVDKTAFTAINTFNHTIRSQISGPVRTVDDNAPLESRGGVVGHMKIQIAKSLGNPDLARSGQVKKVLAEYAQSGDDPIALWASDLDIKDFNGKKNFIAAVIKQGLKDIDKLRKEFHENIDEYSLKLPNGKQVGISPEIIKRTNLSLAEQQVKLVTLLESVLKAQTIPELLNTLYGWAMPGGKEDDEAALSEAVKKAVKKKPVRKPVSRFDNDPARYLNKDAWQIINAYFATLMMSVLMYKTSDAIGLRLLRDKTNFRMTGLHPAMSPLNFWGMPVWRSGTESVKKLIGARAAKELNSIVRRIPPAWYKFLHMDLSFGRDVPINWNDHYRTMTVLQQFPGMKFERINFMLKGVFTYENLTYDQKIKLLNALHIYVAQFLPHSPLFVRLKTIQRGLIYNPNNQDSIMTLSELLDPTQKPIGETADGGAVGAGATGSFPPNLFGTAGKRNVVKRKRNTEIKHLAFKNPANTTV